MGSSLLGGEGEGDVWGMVRFLGWHGLCMDDVSR